tara:strand:- start:53 stop:889 length:837 start_codon:yes stop_codon:yes gene_type:complete
MDFRLVVVILVCSLLWEEADSLSVHFRQARRAIAGVGIAASTTLGGLPSFAEAGSTDVPRYENYIPRKIYPGTYQNYCGPTPEVSPRDGCKAHGWRSDVPNDEVDEACSLHDREYCICDANLRARMGGKVINMLSTQAALRFATGDILKVQGADSEYVACVDKADKDLLVRGLSIREKEERMSNLEQMTESDRRLSWFRKPSVDKDRTLDRFEKINLRIFLASYDKDQGTTLTALEKERQRVLKDALSRNQGDMVKAANDPVVVEAAERQLNMLLQGK